MTTLGRLQHVDTYIGDLRQQMGYWMGWIPNTYADQPSADGFYEILRKDMEVKRCSNLISLMAAGEIIKVTHPDPRVCKLAVNFLSGIREFLHARKSLIEKGIVFGLGVQKKVYDHRCMKGFQGNWKVVRELREVDRRRLRIERDPETKQTYWTLWTPEYNAYVVLEDLAINPKAPYTVQNYMWYIQEYEELAPYFEGYGDVLYPLIWLKRNVIQYWGDLCESWAKPFLSILVDVMKATMDNDIGGTFNTIEARREELIKVFEKARARHVAVIDKNEKLEFHEQGSVGSNILKEFVEYVDKKVNLLFFGTDLATTAGKTGSYALGHIHKEAEDILVLYNRDRLADVIKYDLLVDFFWRNLNLLTLNRIPMPKVHEIGVEITAEREEIDKQLQKEGLDEGSE